MSCVNKCATNFGCNAVTFNKSSQQCNNYAGFITNETQFIDTVGVNTIKMPDLRGYSFDQYCKITPNSSLILPNSKYFQSLFVSF